MARSTKCAERRVAAGALDTAAGARLLREAISSRCGSTPAGEPDGFFTGYYETEIEGSRVRSRRIHVPLYRMPADLVSAGDGKFVRKGGTPYYDRTADRGRRARRPGPGNLLGEEPGRRVLRADPGLDPRQARPTASLLRLNYVGQQRLSLYAGRQIPDRARHHHARRNDDGPHPRMDGGQSGRGPELRRKNRSFVFFRETQLAPHEHVDRRARRSADAEAFDRGRPQHPRLRHADLDRRRAADRERETGDRVPPSDDRAGHRHRHHRAGARRHLISAPARTSATSPAASSNSAHS